MQYFEDAVRPHHAGSSTKTQNRSANFCAWQHQRFGPKTRGTRFPILSTGFLRPQHKKNLYPYKTDFTRVLRIRFPSFVTVRFSLKYARPAIIRHCKIQPKNARPALVVSCTRYEQSQRLLSLLHTEALHPRPLAPFTARVCTLDSYHHEYPFLSSPVYASCFSCKPASTPLFFL